MLSIATICLLDSPPAARARMRSSRARRSPRRRTRRSRRRASARRARREQARGLEQRRGAGGVVVGAVVDLARRPARASLGRRARGDRSGRRPPRRRQLALVPAAEPPTTLCAGACSRTGARPRARRDGCPCRSGSPTARVTTTTGMPASPARLGARASAAAPPPAASRPRRLAARRRRSAPSRRARARRTPCSEGRRSAARRRSCRTPRLGREAADDDDLALDVARPRSRRRSSSGAVMP